MNETLKTILMWLVACSFPLAILIGSALERWKKKRGVGLFWKDTGKELCIFLLYLGVVFFVHDCDLASWAWWQKLLGGIGMLVLLLPMGLFFSWLMKPSTR